MTTLDRQPWRAWSRVLAYVAVVQLAVGGAVAALARARVDEALLRVGEVAMQYAGASHQQAPRSLRVNGARLRLSVGVSEHSVRDVLSHFERSCRLHSGNLGRQLADAISGVDKTANHWTRPHPWPDAVVRVEDEARGVVACLDLGEGQLSMEDLSRRASALLRTGDLSQLGSLRFVSAERGGQQTVFVTAWSDGPIHAAAMFPQQGDAPGLDLPGVPRPAGARRVLSAHEEGQAKAFNAYIVGGRSITQARRDFTAQVVAAGFAVPMEEATARELGGYVAQRGDEAVVVAFAAQDAAETIVTVSSLSDATASVSVR